MHNIAGCVPYRASLIFFSCTLADTPDMYVDMHPVHWDREEEEEEDGPCMGPYASSDLLDRRPDLRT